MWCGYQKEFVECFVNWSGERICGNDGSSDIERRGQNKILEKLLPKIKQATKQTDQEKKTREFEGAI